MQCDRQNLTTMFIHPPFPTHSKYILQVRAVYKTATAVFETLKCIPGLKGYKPLYTMKSLLVQKKTPQMQHAMKDSFAVKTMF